MNIKKLDEVKVLRDPVHEYVRIEYEVIWKLLDTPEFQRLRRIHQLGGSYMVYHGAEHSRFSHSVGVYEIARRMINEVKGLKDVLNEYEQIVVLCAALLHDVGHGPFSHAFESVTGISHETMTIRIILEGPTLRPLLDSVSNTLAKDICRVIDHSHPKTLLTQMISSQIDADRMDYLLRDSYFTGVSYGEYDIERILRTLRIENDRLVIKESGMNAVEDYIMARYQMYWQVYYHPTSRAYEIMLLHIFKRIKDVYQSKQSLIQKNVLFVVPFVIDQSVSLEDYLFLDDNSMIHGFKKLALQNEDVILQDLSTRLLNRDIFKFEENDEVLYQEKEQLLKEKGYPIDYYLAIDSLTQEPYLPYLTKDQQIMILMPDGKVKELSEVSSIVSAIANSQTRSDSKLFFPKLEDL
ncbi:MAG: HD domain-containing protein [Erysipelothrix sp.]|nr:HD domain-containing protein [Erysipelothrix sp.]